MYAIDREARTSSTEIDDGTLQVQSDEEHCIGAKKRSAKMQENLRCDDCDVYIFGNVIRVSITPDNGVEGSNELSAQTGRRRMRTTVLPLALKRPVKKYAPK